MRARTHRPTTASGVRVACVLSLLACLLLPGAVAAQELPDEVEDPPSAFQPQPVEEAPVVPAAPAQPAASGDAAPAGGGRAPAPAEPGRTAVAGASAAPASTAQAPVGTLPFTGTASWQTAWLLLVASLLLVAGFLALVHAAAAEQLRTPASR